MVREKQNIDIKNLQLICEEKENLELKLNWDMIRSKDIKGYKGYTMYEDTQLIGFLGVYGFGDEIEICGMVHPEYRRQGVFKGFFQAAITNCSASNVTRVLLNTPGNSVTGKAFLNSVRSKYSFSEHQMKWHQTDLLVDQPLLLREATKEDFDLRVKLDVECFGLSQEGAALFNTPLKSSTSRQTYIIGDKQLSVGKIGVNRRNRDSWIHGFAIMPEFQGKGIGKRALKQVVQKESELGNNIYLEVEAKNEHALSLYQACGFVSYYTQDYYEYTDIQK